MFVPFLKNAAIVEWPTNHFFLFVKPLFPLLLYWMYTFSKNTEHTLTMYHKRFMCWTYWSHASYECNFCNLGITIVQIQVLYGYVSDISNTYIPWICVMDHITNHSFYSLTTFIRLWMCRVSPWFSMYRKWFEFLLRLQCEFECWIRMWDR